jgi:MSHA pilin protein MshC
VGTARFARIADFDERFFRDDALGALRFAQKLAVASGCPVQLEITGGAYSVTQRAACTSGAFSAPVVHPGTGASSYSGSAPSGLAFSSSVSPLVFDALGRATDSGGAVTDAVVSVGAKTIQVEGETGFAWAG